MMTRVSALLIALILLATGCSRKKPLEDLMPHEGAFAKAYLESIRVGNIEVGRRYLDPRLIGPDTDQNLEGLIEYFPTGELIEVSPVGFKWEENLTNGVFDGRFDFQYHCEDGWAITHITLRRTRKDTTVSSIEITPIRESLQAMNSFTLSDRAPKHYLILGLFFAIPAFIVWSAVLCFKTPMRRRRWLWLLFILFGFVGFTLNWSTGHLGINLVGIRLLGTSAEKASPYAPWMITVSVPAGALVFLAQRRRLAEQAESRPTSR